VVSTEEFKTGFCCENITPLTQIKKTIKNFNLSTFFKVTK